MQPALEIVATAEVDVCSSSVCYSADAEHFVTLFDNNFLSIGMCLHASLLEHGQPFHLWILCLDEIVERNLMQLSLPHVSLIPLREVEDERLLAVKPTRSKGEYCWTLTPFTPKFVLDRAPQVQRITYVDADLFFFKSPKILLDEFEQSDKHVLITDHAYAPEYDRTSKSGRFCVQFMTFRSSPEGLVVLNWWQDRCIEWCFDRYEDGKFGDQMYLDQWPELFPNYVHILKQVHNTLAPWNVDYFLSKSSYFSDPVFYHFQSFRIINSSRVRLYVGIRIGKKSLRFYESYLICIGAQIKILKNHKIALPAMPFPSRRFEFLRKMYMNLFGKTRYADLRSYVL